MSNINYALCSDHFTKYIYYNNIFCANAKDPTESLLND